MARRNEVIALINMAVSSDEIRNQIETPMERTVFARELAVFSSEFYRAAVVGLRAEKIFEVYTREYQGEDRLKHNSITYRIIRTSYGKTSEDTRLTCEKVAADD